MKPAQGRYVISAPSQVFARSPWRPLRLHRDLRFARDLKPGTPFGKRATHLADAEKKICAQP